MTKKEHDDYVPFPIHFLPEVVAEFVNEVVASQNCAPEFVVLPLLSCLGAAIGNAAAMRPKSDWHAPSIFWTATIGESGTGKSPAFKEATQFIVSLENQAYVEYQAELSAYEAEMKSWSKKSEKPAPEPPHHVRYYVEDTTTEGLLAVLEGVPTGVIVINDELSGWFPSFDKYVKSGAGGDAAKWLKLWGSVPVSIDRKTGDKRHCRVKKPIVSIAGTIQPTVLWNVVQKKNVENGMLARFLIAYPPASPQRWRETEPSEKSRQSIKELFKDLYSLNQNSTRESSETLHLQFDDEANEIWIEFYNNNQELVATSPPPLNYAYAKMDQYLLRFASMYHVIENIGEPEIPEKIKLETLGAAIETINWFRSETARAYNLLIDGTKEQRIEKLLAKIKSKEGEMSIRELQRSNSKRYQTADDARNDLQSLVDEKLGYWNYDRTAFILGEYPYTKENIEF